MKNVLKLRNLFLVLSLALVSYGCGKDSGSSSSSGGTVAVTPGVCPAGQVWITQANACIGQGPCQVNQGWYNNSCVMGVNSQNPYYGNGYQNGYYNQYGTQYNGSLYGNAYYSGFPYNQGGSNMYYYYPYQQQNCTYKTKGNGWFSYGYQYCY